MKRRDEMWTQKDGTRIAVGEMSETHVRNALRIVLRNERRRMARLLARIDQARSDVLDDVLTNADDDVLVDPWRNS